jgi:hypothetical protein
MWSILVVDDDTPAAVGLQAGVGQVELLGAALPPRGVHHRLGGNLFAAGQCGDGAFIADVDRGDLLAQPELHTLLAQIKPQVIDDLLVTEVQHCVAFLHDGDLGAQRGE